MGSIERHHKEPLLTYSIASMNMFVQVVQQRRLTGVYTYLIR